MKHITWPVLAAALSLSACQAPETKTETSSDPKTQTAMVTDAALVNADKTPAEWLTYGL